MLTSSRSNCHQNCYQNEFPRMFCNGLKKIGSIYEIVSINKYIRWSQLLQEFMPQQNSVVICLLSTMCITYNSLYKRILQSHAFSECVSLYKIILQLYAFSECDSRNGMNSDWKSSWLRQWMNVWQIIDFHSPLRT